MQPSECLAAGGKEKWDLSPPSSAIGQSLPKGNSGLVTAVSRQKFWRKVRCLQSLREGRGGHLRFRPREVVLSFARADSVPSSRTKMYRSSLRIAPSVLRTARPTLASGSRRFASTAPARKKGTWKGTVLRWGLAAAAVYYYNTSPLFADELPRSCSGT